MEASPTSASSPTIAEYVKRSLDAIDWSKPNAVLYLRGIGDESDWATKMGPEMAARLNRTDTSLSEVSYGNVNTPGAGAASGEAVLAEVLRQLRKRAPHMRVFLAGLSLGAWTIGDTLANNPGLRHGIGGAALIAHTNMAKAHYRMDAGHIREFNLHGDNFSKPLRGRREDVLAAVDELYGGIKPLPLLKHLPTMLRDAEVFWQFLQFFLKKPTAHDNNGPYHDAAFGWLNTLIGPPAAAMGARNVRSA